MEDVKEGESPEENPIGEALRNRIYHEDNLSHEEICEEALGIFKQRPIQIAPAKKILCGKILCKMDWLDDYIDRNGDLAAILEQVTFQQELEVFKKWANGQLREGSAQALLMAIRGDEPGLDLSTVFNVDDMNG
jgi:hypothetical protein